jgi:hypothetical protein
MFVPWEHFLPESSGDINDIWKRQKQSLPRRLAAITGNIELLKRSAEDAKRDARQWAAQSGEADPSVDATEIATAEGEEGDECPSRLYRPDDVGSAIRLIDVLRGATGSSQITAGSNEVKSIVERLCKFEQVAMCSAEDLLAVVIPERGRRTISILGGKLAGHYVPEQVKLKSIKSQQASASRERERTIQGIQEHAHSNLEAHSAAAYRVLGGFGEDDLSIAPANLDPEIRPSEPSTSLRFGHSTSFSETGKQVAESLTLNRRQSIAFQLLCRHLDRVHRGESNVPQLCQFVGGEGGTGKSRVIEALVALFGVKGMAHRLLVTATSGTAAARINGITIHAACNVSVDSSSTAPKSGSTEKPVLSSRSLRVDGHSRMDWQEKDVLVVDEISMLGARTLHAVNEQLCTFRGCTQDFGGIPIVLFLGDFKQFRPVQERSILVPSNNCSWDEGRTFKVEQRYQHDKAHMLWKRFTTVVMLKEQVRAAGDLQLQRLLTRIREGVADQNDVDLLNRACYQEGRRIPWETGITVVTPLNRNRWNLNIEATLSFQRQHQAQMRIFISEHRWKGGQPTEEEALMILRYSDDSSVPIPAIFMFVPGMPIVVNRNTYQGLKLVNGSSYTALDVIIDKAYLGYQVSADTILHFGPPSGIILAGDSTRDFSFVGMPPGTILLTPLSSKIECARRRPWQRHEVTRRGLPCTAAFACTDYKVQGRTLKQVALELRGTRTVQVDGQAVPSQCDPYSLYVQLSRSQSLQGIMLLSKVRERDVIGNTVPESMVAAEKRLEELSDATVREAEAWI